MAEREFVATRPEVEDEGKKSEPAPSALQRREFLRLSTGGALLGALPVWTACSKTPTATSTPLTPSNPGVVRVASVPTAVEGNVVPTLVAQFEQQSGGKRVDLVASDDVYGLARAGKVDLAISHYGHRDAEAFVLDGRGEWPRTLFSNQMALVGPPSDPARIRGLDDAGEAFRRIAETKSPFVLNGIDGVRYLTEILWNAAGRPDRTGWLLDQGHAKEDAIRFASDRGAYALWGLTPFIRADRALHLNLEPLVLGDPLLQRMLVSIIVKAEKAPGVNAAGAAALESFLLSPAIQARTREVRYPGAEHVAWVACGRHNRTAILPKV